VCIALNAFLCLGISVHTEPIKPQLTYVRMFNNQSIAGAVQKNPPLTIKVSEAARLLNITPETLRRHLQEGRIKGVNLGQWLVPVSEIDRLLHSEVRK